MRSFLSVSRTLLRVLLFCIASLRLSDSAFFSSTTWLAPAPEALEALSPEAAAAVERFLTSLPFSLLYSF